MKVLKNYISSIATGVILLLAGCTDDTLKVGDEGHLLPGEGDTLYYINLRLKTSEEISYTRAGENESENESENEEGNEAENEEESKKPNPGSGFSDGTHNEHAIGKGGNFAIFFDENDKYISCADLYSVNEVGVGTPDELDDEGNVIEQGTVSQPDPESIYSCRFYGFAENKPAKILVVVNAKDRVKKKITDFPGWTLQDVMKQVWEESGKYKSKGHYGETDYDPDDNLGFRKENDTKYFTMTNSSYLETDPDNPNVYIMQCAKSIPKNKITTDDEGNIIEEKIYITDDPSEYNKLIPVTVYLERMVSKFTFSLDNTTNNFYIPLTAEDLNVMHYIPQEEASQNENFVYTSYKWRVEILGWGINGLETQSYLFKNIDADGQYFIDNKDWNSSYHHRCYWSEDPHYNREQALYPWQTKIAANIKKDQQDIRDAFHYWENEEPAHPYSLVYYPFTKYCENFFTKDEESGETVVNEKFSFKDDPSNVIYAPENTFQPGLQVDPSRGASTTRAYELAGAHLLLFARLQYFDPEDGKYKYLDKLYRNRVGVCYLKEVDVFEDFINAVSYKLESNKSISYIYYNWTDEELKEAYVGEMRHADSQTNNMEDGKNYTFSLYIMDDTKSKTENGVKKDFYIELSYDNLTKMKNDPSYSFSIESKTLNGDGKVRPRIIHNGKTVDFYILRKERGTQSLSDDGEENGEEIDYNADGLEGIYLSVEEYNERRIKFKDSSDRDLSADTNDRQSLLYEVWGEAELYDYGLMYYAIPIRALSENRAAYTLANTPTDDKNYYGVIRNNHYKFKLNSINDLGVPIADPNMDIVPNYRSNKNQVKLEMELVQWHIQNLQVDLSKVK